ncbi:MAG: ABC transporter permease [Phycisphaerales bacterium]|nr:ABC transporter permease [Phycisphaerales bacterium]
MRGVWTIAAREVQSFFRLPVGWIVVALYAFLSALVFIQSTLIPGSPATMRYFFAAAAWMMVPVAPAISMRLLSEEARTGTIEMLRTAPVGDFAVALGKLLGAWLFLGITLAPTLVLPLTLIVVSEPAPDPGPILAGYLTLFLVGGLFLGIGLVASALTSSQTLAFLGTLMGIVLLLMLTSLAGPLQTLAGTRVQELAGAFSIIGRVDALSKGVFDSAAVAYFLIAIGWSVVIAAAVLETRRLARPRAVNAGLWAGFILATGASAVLLGVLTHDYRIRADITASGAHRLSPRAERMAGLIEDPTELVFAVDLGGADRRAVDLVTDVLGAYQRSNPNIGVRVIDLGVPAGIEQTDELLGVLAARESARAGRIAGVLRENTDAMRSLAQGAERLARELDAVRDAIPAGAPAASTNRMFFEQRAGLLRVGSRELNEQADAIQTALDEPRGPAGLPDADRIIQPAMTVWRSQRTQLNDLAEQAQAFSQSELAGPDAGPRARTAAATAARLRDEAAVNEERLERLPRLDTLRVARALETGESLLVIGPPSLGVSAVDLEALLPPVELLERAGLSAAGVIGPRAQELIATAIGRLVRPDRPIVVFTHAQPPGTLFVEGGPFARVRERLLQQEIDSLEWAALEQVEPAGLTRLDPAGIRPVVFIVISPDSTAGSAGGRLTGAQRAGELATTVARLIEAGEPVLLNLNPSIFPTYGDRDPLAALSATFGLIPRTGKPLLRSTPGGPAGRMVDPHTSVVAPNPGADAHPAADALRGLRLLLPWATAIDLEERPNTRAWPVVKLTGEGASESWAESRWLRLWSEPAASRSMMANPPAFDLGEDERRDRWVLAAAAERDSRLGVSRFVVVGSNGWASDGAVMGATQLVDGRIAARYPGNGVLLDGLIHWLAGLDELIAPGADARPVATVKPLDPSQLTRVRWMLLGLVPGVILIAGGAWRALRG